MFFSSISIIIPIYNTELYIERCAHSLFKQTFQDIEYIFVNDCSTDSTVSKLLDIIDLYEYRRSKIKIVNLSQNRGAAYARYIGLQNATGEYVIHCDSDDWFVDNGIEKLYKKAKSESCDIVMCDWFEGDGIRTRVCKQKYDVDKNVFLSNIIKRSVSASLCNKLIKRSLYITNGIVHPTYTMMEDFALFLQVVYFSDKICYLEEALYYYYDNFNSVCKKQTEQAMLNRCLQAEANVRLVIDFLDKQFLLAKYRNEIVWLKYYVRVFIWPLVLSDYRRYYIKWINIFPEINKRFIFTKGISFRYKLIFLLTCLGIYPWLLNIKKRIKK